MQHGQHFHAIRESDVIDDVPESPQPCGPDLLPNRAVHLGHGFNAGQNFPHAGDEATAQAGLDQFQLVVRRLDVGVGGRAKENR